jgi:hypothetical protein
MIFGKWLNVLTRARVKNIVITFVITDRIMLQISVAFTYEITPDKTAVCCLYIYMIFVSTEIRMAFCLNLISPYFRMGIFISVIFWDNPFLVGMRL